jgi:hypothetical protein
LFRISPYWRRYLVALITAMLWAQKQRELHNHHFDSIWNDFAFRGDDIIIAPTASPAPPRCSRSWGSFCSRARRTSRSPSFSPWLDLRVPRTLGLSPVWVAGGGLA